MDIFSKKKRKEIMSHVKSKNTKDEILIRSLIHRLGLRFSLHKKELPGTPDIYLKKHKTVIFVNGCFWHGHKNCKRAKLPKTNHEFWKTKVERNKKRDAQNYKELKKLNLKVMIIWTCEIKNKEKLLNRIIKFFRIGKKANT